mgnify:CR=1 FL=1
MTSNFGNAGIFLIDTFLGLYLVVVVLRFLIQASRVDYYNPICQAIIKISDPISKPFRKILPTIKRIDFSALMLAVIVQVFAALMIILITDYSTYFLDPILIAWSLLGIIAVIIDIYFIALLISVGASWIAPFSNHPALSLVHQITEPICAPARKLLPPIGGMDFSIILVFVMINLIDSYFLVRPLAEILGVIPDLVLWA